ncbi:probable cytochrome P450 6a13 [Periplaneta americana]|uniref:probable cytochrome P450 6a13 n=1 Tax=Periplaneta americana TaxID=6978 RepID=UPI0037E85933
MDTMLNVLNSLPLQALALSAVVLILAYFYKKSSYSYWTKLGIYNANPTFPFGNFGNVILKNTNTQLLFKKIYNETEGHRLVGLHGFSTKFLLVRDTELIKNILLRDFDHFHSRGIKINEKAEPLQMNLFFLSGTKWRHLRVKLTPTFTSGKMKMMFGTLVECGKELKSVLQEHAGETIEVKDILARFTTDVIASCAFGIQCNCLKNPDAEFRQWGRKIFSPSFRMTVFRIVNFFSSPLARKLGLSFTPSDVSNYFRKMVNETVEYRENNNVQRNDFMQLLIQLKNNPQDQDNSVNGSRYKLEENEEDEKSFEITMDVVAAQAFVFFNAGFETSSTTMTFCLYELAVNTDIQERVREEIDAVLRKHDGNITYESLFEMEYLDKVVNETLRKYPPVQNLFRECAKPYKIPGTDAVLEKGMRVFIPVMGLHYDPKYYPEPERFDPERFSDREKSRRPQYTYLPFGEGPRICIGMRFGLMQTKVGLISLLSSYVVHVSEKTPVPLVFDNTFILAPKGGLHLKITNRPDKRR